MENQTEGEILHNLDKVNKAPARPGIVPRLKRDLTHEAVTLALKGEWERATEVNRAILELFEDDVEAMNRLGKALMEMGWFVLVVVFAVGGYFSLRKSVRMEQALSRSLAQKDIAPILHQIHQLDFARRPDQNYSISGPRRTSGGCRGINEP